MTTARVEKTHDAAGELTPTFRNDRGYFARQLLDFRDDGAVFDLADDLFDVGDGGFGNVQYLGWQGLDYVEDIGEAVDDFLG